jgi:hypothetical protein|tara:strand:+ start:273 stop:560 length:288 start_codon:yes stop_codon:yes gene_type:complete
MLKLETSPEDFFWQEKMLRAIESCTSLSELKEMATLLVKIATTRQTAVKGLVKDNLEMMTNGLHNWLDKVDDEPVDDDWHSRIVKPNPYPGASKS